MSTFIRILVRSCLLLIIVTALLTTSTQRAVAYNTAPVLPNNNCNNSSLPNNWGTNYSYPNDPYANGFPNDAAVGWTGNYYAPIAYMSGAYWARGVPVTSNVSGTNYCGAMYQFSVYTWNGNRPAQSVQWTMDNGYLPALTT